MDAQNQIQNIFSFLHSVAKKKNLSHKRIGEKMGMSRQNITSILSGKRNLTIENLLKLCQVLGVEISFEIE